MISRDNVIVDVVRAARSALDVRKVLLFGSRATGLSGPDSDYDFLIVAETSLSPGSRIDVVRKKLLHLTAPLDIIVVRPDEFQRLLGWSTAEAAGRPCAEVLDGTLRTCVVIENRNGRVLL